MAVWTRTGEDRSKNPTGDWKARRSALLRFFEVHPGTVEQARKSLGDADFASYQAARRAIASLEKRGKLRFLGRVQLNDVGRPSDVFCCHWVKKDILLHEVLLTSFLSDLSLDACLRGGDVDQQVRPDAEITMDGNHWYVELDTGQCGYRDVQKRRDSAYANRECNVVWVVLTESRLDGFRQRFEHGLCTEFFTVLGGRDWINRDGTTL